MATSGRYAAGGEAQASARQPLQAADVNQIVVQAGKVAIHVRTRPPRFSPAKYVPVDQSWAWSPTRDAIGVSSSWGGDAGAGWPLGASWPGPERGGDGPDPAEEARRARRRHRKRVASIVVAQWKVFAAERLRAVAARRHQERRLLTAALVAWQVQAGAGRARLRQAAVFDLKRSVLRVGRCLQPELQGGAVEAGCRSGPDGGGGSAPPGMTYERMTVAGDVRRRVQATAVKHNRACSGGGKEVKELIDLAAHMRRHCPVYKNPRFGGTQATQGEATQAGAGGGAGPPRRMLASHMCRTALENALNGGRPTLPAEVTQLDPEVLTPLHVCLKQLYARTGGGDGGGGGGRGLSVLSVPYGRALVIKALLADVLAWMAECAAPGEGFAEALKGKAGAEAIVRCKALDGEAPGFLFDSNTQKLYSAVSSSKSSGGPSSVKASVYKNDLFDTLTDRTDNRPAPVTLAVRSSGKLVYSKPEEIKLETAQDARRIFDVYKAKRSVSGTGANTTSSRSHALMAVEAAASGFVCPAILGHHRKAPTLLKALTGGGSNIEKWKTGLSGPEYTAVEQALTAVVGDTGQPLESNSVPYGPYSVMQVSKPRTTAWAAECKALGISMEAMLETKPGRVQELQEWARQMEREWLAATERKEYLKYLAAKAAAGAGPSSAAGGA
ncbi:hypothetical protein HYH03_018000 [Edaphochlamys debaryana]|uniref:Kinesin motor domain-containing protein n=1 Tax=Edaphochlamys debaryana TaxID=47281 RepID=A0A835XEL7_9CHLO|nr:hypothetical protein HYH03_018000 [Edaphochlamys debaryana]|eukprot:KAG2483107.1 hypothetical protein HYH03_018000 [Edaphochlamys debaryana]